MRLLEIDESDAAPLNLLTFCAKRLRRAAKDKNCENKKSNITLPLFLLLALVSCICAGARVKQ